MVPCQWTRVRLTASAAGFNAKGEEAQQSSSLHMRQAMPALRRTRRIQREVHRVQRETCRLATREQSAEEGKMTRSANGVKVCCPFPLGPTRRFRHAISDTCKLGPSETPEREIGFAHHCGIDGEAQ